MYLYYSILSCKDFIRWNNDRNLLRSEDDLDYLKVLCRYDLSFMKLVILLCIYFNNDCYRIFFVCVIVLFNVIIV